MKTGNKNINQIYFISEFGKIISYLLLITIFFVQIIRYFIIPRVKYKLTP